MKTGYKILSALSAAMLLGGSLCLIGYADEEFQPDNYNDDTTYSEPVTVQSETTYSEPDYNYTSSAYYDESTVVSEAEEYAESEWVEDYESEFDDDVSSSTTASELLESIYSSEAATSSSYSDYTEYGSYVNPYSSTYDDDYVYVTSETIAEDAELIDNSSKALDTDELTEDDWAAIMLALEDGSESTDGTGTFNFIKENEEEQDQTVDWMLYVGVALIIAAVFVVAFVVISTSKAMKKSPAKDKLQQVG